MSKSLGQANKEQQEKYGTLNNTHDMFPIGSKVRVICLCQDMYFFNPDTQNTYGTVIRNGGRYLSIIVQWDEPRHYEGGYIQTEFNFDPKDMVLASEVFQEDKDAKIARLENELKNRDLKIKKLENDRDTIREILV